VIRTELEKSAAVIPEGQSVEGMVALTTSGPLGTVTGVVAVVGAVIAPILAAMAVAAVLHLLGTVVGGQQTYTQMFTLVSWARVPLVVGGLLWLAYAATGHFDPNPDGLSGLVAADPLAGGGKASFAEPALAQVEVWNLWYVALLALAVRAASRVSLSKAAVVVAVLVAVEVALGLAGVSISRMFAGAFG
jgi:hypothetical protein